MKKTYDQLTKENALLRKNNAYFLVGLRAWGMICRKLEKKLEVK